MGCPKLKTGNWRFVSAGRKRPYLFHLEKNRSRSAPAEMDDDFDYRFSSEYLDSETNLVYYNYRYYSPELGRWTKRDPIGEFTYSKKLREMKFNLLYGFVENDAVNKWDYLGQKVFVVKRPLTAVPSWWAKHLTAIGALIGSLSPAIGILPGLYWGKVGQYYAGKTWHCSLVVACSTGKGKSTSIGGKGGLVDMKDINPEDTWDFQFHGNVNNPADDWDPAVNTTFPGSYYAGRKSIETIVDDDSQDANLLKILNAEPKQQKYILGGSKRYNCCDWVSKVLKGINQDYDSGNPSPFGNATVPWWVPAGAIGKLIDTTQ